MNKVSPICTEDPIDAVPLRVARVGPMQRSGPMSLFVLNRVCELVDKGIRFDRVFKEQYINKVSNYVLDFTGITVSTSQIYKHLRKWRQRWMRVSPLKKLEAVTWCEDTTTMKMDEDKLIMHTMVRIDN